MEWSSRLNELMECLKPGAFLSAEHGGVKNTMTIGWGYAGIMWNKPYFIALVRPSRYTHDLIVNSKEFTVSVPKAGSMSPELKTCGVKSGRDINKSEVVRFVDGKSVNAPVVYGCDMYFECRVNYFHALDKALMPAEILDSSYQDNSLHTLFFGEIVDYYEK
ncbi:MAG: flavin reductase family protein [Clostridiales bacterium]|jgi:flavin reductase (DIM6/NTAB) family NADH-FMN oxidoreductase RutF|nr:flavin reductase family protein [Clostridiales bacterium]